MAKLHSFPEFTDTHKSMVDQELLRLAEGLRCPQVLKDAMAYSLKAGGKRIRPMLLFAVMDAFGKRTEEGLEAACAIEIIHTYSLIHDDLPCMDDDDLRRGQPTNHKVFGDANAVLAGDALLTYSFQLLSAMNRSSITDKQKIKLIDIISSCAGPEGMVGGQVADMEAEGKTIKLEDLIYIHENKTGKLLEASILAGAVLADAGETEKEKLKEFSQHLGLAFQIRDDILDVEGDESAIGKPVGSDSLNEKNTYPFLLSLDGAKRKLEEEFDKAMDLLKQMGFENTHLQSITEWIVLRNH